MSLRPTPVDAYPTPTSETQAETERVLLAHSPSATEKQGQKSEGKQPDHSILQKNAHLQFLIRNLLQGFPARYISQDASQPWLLFWTLQACAVLGVGLDSGVKERSIQTLLYLQSPDGGFCGGSGQSPHLLPTYAAVCALAIVGKPGPGGGWADIDREKMYEFFMSLKQPDGSFLVMRHGEVDVRGIYCLLATATLLDIITPELVKGTAAFIASCQTYEGGFSSASHPYYSYMQGMTDEPTLLQSLRPPLGEAHGGYTFCAVASWALLKPFTTDTTTQLQIHSLRRWLVNMQGLPIELGGFKGRTNKLVDGCYSWWVGGAFALLDVLEPPSGSLRVDQSKVETHMPNDGGDHNVEEDDWVDIDDSLLNRRALQEYILYAAQHPAGGLRDKPPKNADAYHTLYCLAGLSAAQHRLFPDPQRKEVLKAAWKPSESRDAKAESLREEIFISALCWSEEEGTEKIVGGKDNRVNATHPLFNLTVTHSEGIMGYFYGQQVPVRHWAGKKK